MSQKTYTKKIERNRKIAYVCNAWKKAAFFLIEYSRWYVKTNIIWLKHVLVVRAIWCNVCNQNTRTIRTTTAFFIPLTHIYFTRFDNISSMVQGCDALFLLIFWFTFIPFELSVKKHHSTVKQCQSNWVIIHLQCEPFFLLFRPSRWFFVCYFEAL